jgi:leader peptidase (prepilin peptidase) / N-methyltransferase
MIVIILAVLGAIVGSFVGAAVLRVPAGRGIVTGRSSCDGCGTILGPLELIPILSFIGLRGRCRRCQTRIAIDQPIAELACATTAILTGLYGDGLADIGLLAIFGWMLVALALLDLRHHWLPDALTLSLLLLGLLRALLPGHDLQMSLLGVIAGYGVLELVRRTYRRLRGQEGLGGGDPKLYAAIGAWLGLTALPWVLLLAGLLGLAVAGVRALRGHGVSRLDSLPLGSLMAVAAIVLIPVFD